MRLSHCLFKGHAQAQWHNRDASASAEGTAEVGVDARGQAGVEFDPRRGDIEAGAKGSAFAGAKGE